MVESFIAQTAAFAADVREAAAAARELAADAAAARAEVEALNAAMGDSAGAAARAAAADEAVSAAASNAAESTFRLSAASRLQVETSQMLAASDAMVAASSAMVSDAYARQARDAALLAAANRVLKDSQELSGAAMARQALMAVNLVGSIRSIGTWIHWIIAGGAELLATLVPALVALGAAALVAMQGAQMLQLHMQSLYTATEATANIFHVTFGQALGLRSALQQAQDQANPIVWSVLGASLRIVQSNFQGLANAGLDVMRIFQTFAARVVVDFQTGLGGTVHNLLANMVADLTMFAQILGNAGHALLNFANAMPGLAEVLLKIADAVSRVILWLSQLPPWVITTVMVFEEIYRWGGLAATILARIPIALTALITSGFGVIPVFTRIAEIFRVVLTVGPAFVAMLAGAAARFLAFIPAAAAAATATEGFAASVVTAIAGLSTFELVLGAVAAAGIGFLIYKAATGKDAIGQLTASMQHAADTASGFRVFNIAAANVAVLSGALHQAQANLAATQHTTEQGAHAWDAYYGRVSAAADAVTRTSQAISQQQRDMANAAQAVGFLSEKYGVSFVGALELGTQAGIRWDAGIGRMSTMAEINLIKVLNLMRGYQAMGASAGVVGNDMTALAIQAGLQTTKVAQLTQAWDAYLGLLTGGTSALAGFEAGLKNMTSGVATTQNNLSQASGNMTLSVSGFANSLRHFTGTGAQAWQNFNQVVSSSAQQFIDWMDNAAAVGMVSGNQLSGAIKGVVLQLLPFASHSAAARAELSGLAQEAHGPATSSLKTLEQWAREGGMSARQLGQFVSQTTVKLSDMAQVAANLGTVMQSDLVNMFDQARLRASGLTGDLAALTQALSNAHTPASVIHGDLLHVIDTMNALHVSVPTITALINSLGLHISQAGVESAISAGKISGLQAAINALHSKTVTVTTNLVTNEVHNLFTYKSHASFGGRQSGGPVQAGVPYLVGEAGRELFIPRVPGDMLSSPDTERVLSNPASALAAGVAGTGGGGTITLEATIPITVEMDGEQAFSTVKRAAYTYETRNSGRRTGKLTPGL